MSVKESASVLHEANRELTRLVRRYERLLHEVYGMYGPRESGKLLPLKDFAKMSPREVAQWDFPARHSMRRIARALSNYTSPR